MVEVVTIKKHFCFTFQLLNRLLKRTVKMKILEEQPQPKQEEESQGWKLSALSAFPSLASSASPPFQKELNTSLSRIHERCHLGENKQNKCVKILKALAQEPSLFSPYFRSSFGLNV